MTPEDAEEVANGILALKGVQNKNNKNEEGGALENPDTQVRM